jgi:hypothetical protein
MSFKYKKGPLFFTTALIFATPICIAQAALLPSGASYGLPVSTKQQTHTQKQALQALLRPAGSFLSQNPQTIQSSSIPSLADITSLEDAIENVKDTLLTLSKKSPSDPANAEIIQSQIQTAQSRLSLLTSKLSELKTEYTNYVKAEAALNAVLKKYQQAQQTESSLTQVKTVAQTSYELAVQALEAAKTEVTRLTLLRDTALAEKNAALLEAQTAINNLTDAEAALLTAQSDYNLALETRQTAQNVLNTKQELLTNKANSRDAAVQAQIQANSNFELAYEALDQAQTNYDTLLIPDPTWTIPTQLVQHTRQVANTRLVPYTELVQRTGYVFNESSNILPPLSATQWTGAGTGFQGSQPSINEGILKFSYMNQTVTYQTNANLSGTLTLTVDVKNLDQNRNQQDTYELRLTTYDAWGNVNGEAYYYGNNWHDWNTKTVEVTPSSQVASYKVDLTGFDAGYWYGTYGPEMRNPRLSGYVTTEVTYFEEVTTLVEETFFTEEIYYTEEPVLSQGTIQVQINEGGQATFTAPQGAVFVSSNLRYEAKDRPECGANIQPSVNGLNQVTIQALNSVWGDPCGGWYKHVTGTLSYLGQPTAPLINNPALLPALQQAQEEYDAALDALNTAEDDIASAQAAYEAASAQEQEAQSALEVAVEDLAVATSVLDAATSTKSSAEATKTSKEETLTRKTSAFTTSQQELDVAAADLTSKSTTEATTKTELETATSNLEAAQVTTTTTFTESTVAESTLLASSKTLASVFTETAKEPLPDLTPTEQLLIKPAPPVVEEEGSKEIPKDLSAENLMEVDLNKVDPTELTEEQAEQLVEAALETFETAEQGSAEYEQALDALYLAAEQDDIVLDEALAAIPGLAGAVEVLNFLGNAGADMSPKVREQSEKVVVTAVVAAGVAVQAAAGAATSAAVSSSAPSGGSRRIGK